MKIILTLFLFMLFTIGTRASYTGIPNSFAGVQIGANINTLKTNKIPYKIDPNLGYSYGIHYLINLGVKKVLAPFSAVAYYNSGILLNLEYLNRNNKFTNLENNVSGNLSNDILQIRINYLYYIYKNFNYSFYIYGGPIIGYLFDTKISNKSGIIFENEKPYEMLLNIGFKINKRIKYSLFGIEYNYQHGLTNLNNNFDLYLNRTHNLYLTFKLLILW